MLRRLADPRRQGDGQIHVRLLQYGISRLRSEPVAVMMTNGLSSTTASTWIPDNLVFEIVL